MKAWNSTLKRSGSQMRRSPMARNREKKGLGLAQRVADLAGTAIKHMRRESNLLRSEQHRRNVAALPCVKCGVAGLSQAAHANAGEKGMALKNCDSLTFPLCCDRPGVRGCHSLHDRGAVYAKGERALREWEHIDATRAELIRQNKWPPAVEAAYQSAIEPLARMVHGD